MRRLFLAAGVASLAIAGAAAAKPGGDHGGGGGNPHAGGGGGGDNPHGGGGGGGNPHGGGGGGGAPVFAGGGGGHGGEHGGAPQFMGGGGGRGHGGGGFAPMFARGEGGGRGHGGGFAAPQVRTFEGGGRGHGRAGFAAPRMRAYEGVGGYGRGGERRQARAFAGGNGHGRGQHAYSREQARAFASEGHGHRLNGNARQQARAFAGDGHGQQQAQRLAREEARGLPQQQARMAGRQQLRASSMQAVQQQALTSGLGNGQKFAGPNAMKNTAQFANQPTWNGVSPYQSLAYGNNVQILPVQQVEQFVGAPVANVAGFAALAPLPTNIQYLYPDTPDYYYRWGDGYLYQVDRTDNLIAALIPLLAGGYLPGQYLPQPYMASYVPNYYGFNSFYPDDGDVCNRYYDGVIYQVDCSDGYVENVIPMYAGGYGVGQLLPSAYSYYNVPVQYRDLYYDTPDYGYWYAPGAIYQYDPRTSVITSVAALMSPGFAVGQPLPMGYDAYNVPYAYRATYYDTPDAWYRYSNGYIYQVDPVTQVVTAIVASLLT